MKLTIQQLQAQDFLQQRVRFNNETKFAGKNLKLVFMYEGILWSGEFVRFKDQYALLHQLENDFTITDRALDDYSFSTVKEPIKDIHNWIIHTKKHSLNPLYKTEELSIFFNILLKFVINSKLDTKDNSFESKVYNAQSLDGTITLPFIDLSPDIEIELISITEIETDNNI